MADLLKLILPLSIADEVERRQAARLAKELAGKQKKREAHEAARLSHHWRRLRLVFDPVNVPPHWRLLMAMEPGEVYTPADVERIVPNWTAMYLLKTAISVRQELGFIEQLPPNPAPSWRDMRLQLTADGETWRKAMIARRKAGDALPEIREAQRVLRAVGLAGLIAYTPKASFLPSGSLTSKRQEMIRLMCTKPRALSAGELVRRFCD